jgi:hypothetical protein
MPTRPPIELELRCHVKPSLPAKHATKVLTVMIPAKVQKLEVELSRRISLLPLLVIPNTNGTSLGTTSVEVDGAGPQPSDDIGG